MNTKIPFTKDIPFEKKVCEITSISLEHEIKVEDSILKGNFIVSGDYKSHEVSINKEPFSYMLPFEIELASDIDTDTIEFMIDDFTYEVIDNSALRVNIDFNIIANKKEIIEEPETIFEDASNLFLDKSEEREEIVNEDDELEEGEEDLTIENKVEENLENNDIREQIDIPVESKEEIVQNKDIVVEEKKEVVSEDTIINSITNTSDEYATYHIHMVSDGETIETICTMYNSNLNILSEYNELNEVNAGDKIIIPEKNE